MKKLALFLIATTAFLAGCSQQQSDITAFESGYTAEQKESLAICLTEKNVVMYGTERCPHCKDQKAAFGEAFAKATYVDCDKQSLQCQTAGVQGFPTWIGGSSIKLEGTQTLADLATAAGCTIQ
ncbi:hypothetical protein KA037_01040 [Patescibacteria group bacterium]|jgi:uncharacterized lipoprotein NlpE involved in copper resistance|nr:hypothetical protein [Patescibacteria group bacterium]MBP7841250.1 hypothetical protein [Patescibacteria group bacterium]